MESTFRKSMNWLHTWAGVVLGSLLFVMFWMGTLSVFDREIDRWMIPATRIAPAEAQRTPSLDALARGIQSALPRNVAQWGMTLPTPREPTPRVFYPDADGEFQTRWADPRTGRLLADPGTKAGTGFIYPFHFMLHVEWKNVGAWIVGAAAMAMLALLVTGVVAHRKIFIDFFLFRPRKQLARSALDLHNMTGVLALPFHMVMTLSGLIIFMGIYFPMAPKLAYRDAPTGVTFASEAYGAFVRDKAGRPGTMASLDVMSQQATHAWGGRPSFVRIWNPGDANAYVEMRRSHEHDVTLHLDTLYFDAASGRVLARFTAPRSMNVQRFIAGLHMVQFDRWTLRWLYFAMGLSSCVMIATGFLYWLESRRARHAKLGLRGVTVVQALTVGSVTGIVLATLALLVANRLLPAAAHVGDTLRASLEVWSFFGAWLAAFVHAAMRPARAWLEQCGVIAVLAVAAVVLNAVTTGDDPLHAIAGGLWSVAGVDLMLLATSALATFAALRIARRQRMGSTTPRRRATLVAEAG